VSSRSRSTAIVLAAFAGAVAVVVATRPYLGLALDSIRSADAGWMAVAGLLQVTATLASVALWHAGFAEKGVSAPTAVAGGILLHALETAVGVAFGGAACALLVRGSARDDAS
jgi:hypothetical protein